MPAQPVSINLIGDQDLQHSPAGRIVSWAVTYGRYIMIGTEVVVLLAFISRFSLDRKKVDLSDEIEQKQMILQANALQEQQIRQLQASLQTVNEISSGQSNIHELLVYMRTILPSDVNVQTLSVNQSSITLTAIAGTNEGFSTLLGLLRTGGKFENIDLGEVKKSPLTGISFQLTATLPVAKRAQTTKRDTKTK